MRHRRAREEKQNLEQNLHRGSRKIAGPKGRNIVLFPRWLLKRRRIRVKRGDGSKLGESVRGRDCTLKSGTVEETLKKALKTRNFGSSETVLNLGEVHKTLKREYQRHTRTTRGKKSLWKQ